MKICVPVREKSQAKVLRVLSEVRKSADLAEVWLDQVADLDIGKLIKHSPVPLVCVCKRPDEKGSFKGSYSHMADMLILAIQQGVTYVDIPLDMPKNLSTKVVHSFGMSKVKCQRSNVTGQRSKVIISYHNFIQTPDSRKLLQIVGKMKSRGADVVKLAVTAKSFSDTFSIIRLARILQKKAIPHILIAMGKKGMLTRVITPFLGGEMMFAPLKRSSSTASGQLTVKELKNIWKKIEDK